MKLVSAKPHGKPSISCLDMYVLGQQTQPSLNLKTQLHLKYAACVRLRGLIRVLDDVIGVCLCSILSLAENDGGDQNEFLTSCR